MPHPWKCRTGHENLTAVPKDENVGPRRRLVLKCSEQGCASRSWIFVGSDPGPFPTGPKRRGVLKTREPRD